MNVGTSRRSYLLPEGDVSKVSVQESNTLVRALDGGLHVSWRSLGPGATAWELDATTPPHTMASHQTSSCLIACPIDTAVHAGVG